MEFPLTSQDKMVKMEDISGSANFVVDSYVRNKYECFFPVEPYNKQFIDRACSVCTVSSVFLVQTSLTALARSVPKTSVPYFTVQT